jgi:hypothetical protein
MHGMWNRKRGREIEKERREERQSVTNLFITHSLSLSSVLIADIVS